MRVVMFTGKGGVGKTTAAAGTAALAARRGVKTLVVSTDAAHSLADALEVSGGEEPVEVAPSLFLAEADPRALVLRSWDGLQQYLVSMLCAAGVDPIAAHEITVLPGAEEVLALLAVRDHVTSGRFDLVVVDCAPTAETLRLLALPEAIDHYVGRLLPLDSALARALRPTVGRVTGMPLPAQQVLVGAARLRDELSGVREVLRAPSTSVRLVLTPERVVVAEARRTLTTLSLHGYVVDAVVANRVFPDRGADPWRRRWVRAQREQLALADEAFAPVPVLRAAYAEVEPSGAEQLADVAEAFYGDLDPLAEPTGATPVSVIRDGDGFRLEVALPFTDRSEVELARRGDDLILGVGPRARVLSLPSALRRCVVTGAAFSDGRLRVCFEPDPALWLTP